MRLYQRGCEKAAEFVNFCNAFNIPLLTLVNVKDTNSAHVLRRKSRQSGRASDPMLSPMQMWQKLR